MSVTSAAQAKNPLLLRTESRKGFMAGTHRTRSPAETFEAYRRWMPEMGITRIANITGLDVIGLPVYTAIRPNSRSLWTSQGKGIDDTSAKTSALMEAIELWHAKHIDEANLRWDTYGRMRRRERTVDVAPIATRGAIATDIPLLWVEGFCLLTQAPIWVPFDLVSQCDLAVGGVPSVPLQWDSTGSPRAITSSKRSRMRSARSSSATARPSGARRSDRSGSTRRASRGASPARSWRCFTRPKCTPSSRK